MLNNEKGQTIRKGHEGELDLQQYEPQHQCPEGEISCPVAICGAFVDQLYGRSSRSS